MKYNDESGEFLGGISGFIRGMVKKPFKPQRWVKYAGKGLSYDFKIAQGLFKGNPKQILSRFTWELPQTTIGYGFSSAKNMWGEVDHVKYFDGATFVINDNSSHYRGVSLGSYINMDIYEKYDKSKYELNKKFVPFYDPMFMHEYGHYINSQRIGLSYLFAVGIPSLASETFFNKENYNSMGLSRHMLRSFEKRANRLAAKYFKEYDVNWSGIKYENYPF